MRTIDACKYAMLVRVRDFGLERGGLFPSSTPGGQMFAAVAASVTELSRHATTQQSGGGAARKGVTSKAVARQALRAQLEKIARTARALAGDTPDLDDRFRLPPGQTDQALLSTARAFAADATPLATVFVSHELPQTFLVDLAQAIERFEEAIHDRAVGKGTHAAARAGIQAAMRSGFAAVRKLDAIVLNKLDHDLEALAAWESARHVEQPPRARKGAAKATTPTPPIASATPAAATANGPAGQS